MTRVRRAAEQVRGSVADSVSGNVIGVNNVFDSMLYIPAVDMAEPKVVVAHREDLWWMLAEACQLEHMIMCQYLFAEWTLKDESDGLTAEQAATIERWRGRPARDRGRGDAPPRAGREPDVVDRRGAGVRPAQLPAALGLLPRRASSST